MLSSLAGPLELALAQHERRRQERLGLGYSQATRAEQVRARFMPLYAHVKLSAALHTFTRVLSIHTHPLLV